MARTKILAEKFLTLILGIQNVWRLIIYKTENSKRNFTVFEGPLAVRLSTVPKEMQILLSGKYCSSLELTCPIPEVILT